MSQAEAMKRRQAINAGNAVVGSGQKLEDKPDSPEFKKKQALQKGPVLELAQENPLAYGMGECAFTGLKDIFAAMIESNSRTGVISPQRFLEIFKRDNENFRTSMHQDAHEFYGLILNDVITTIEENDRKVHEQERKRKQAAIDGGAVCNGHAVVSSHGNRSITSSSGLSVGWVHDIFEGLITSETKCLACETTSQRDETFLDLSIDLEEHSSVTSCLKNFSAEEMLCERNKFHCDTCGGLQEAEKRMKIKKLPKVIALHLKRFKYTEDYSRLQKLFHRVVYPYYLRVFNTTDDVEDPDRMYELYAVVVHIGGNAYHGHYVSVIKTQDRGWLLFDDEMVEPVDKHFVKNFFGDKPGMACAYLLLYQETTFEKALADQEAEGYLDVDVVDEGRVSVGEAHTLANGTAALSKQATAPNPTLERHTSEPVATVKLKQAATAQGEFLMNGNVIEPNILPVPVPGIRRSETTTKSKWELKKEAKAQEKARKQEEKEREKAEAQKRKEAIIRPRERRKAEAEDTAKATEVGVKDSSANGMAVGLEEPESESKYAPPALSGELPSRKHKSTRIMSKKSFPFLRGRDKTYKDKKAMEELHEDGAAPTHSILPRRATLMAVNGHKSESGPHQLERIRERFNFNLGRKKSSPLLGQAIEG